MYSAFADGDAPRLQQLLADTHWVEATGTPYGDTYRGFGEIAANVFGPIAADVKEFTVDPEEIIPAGSGRVEEGERQVSWRLHLLTCGAFGTGT